MTLAAIFLRLLTDTNEKGLSLEPVADGSLHYLAFTYSV